MPLNLVASAAGVRLKLKVVPGSSRDRVVGVLGDALKVAVSKPPEGGAANRAVVQLLAETLSLAPAQITIVAGIANPRKEVLITGVNVDDLRRRLDAR